MDEYELIKGYHVRSDEIEKETMRYMTVMWNMRQRHKRMRDFDGQLQVTECRGVSRRKCI